MFFDDAKFQAWKQQNYTKLMVSDVQDAISDLSYKLVYEENPTQISIIQGMLRAYMDIASNLESGDFVRDSDEV